MKSVTKRYIAISVLAFICSFGVFAKVPLPNWVLNPSVDDGLAAVDCVQFSGNVSVDAKLASSNARLALAQQISTKVEAIDETYDSRIANSAQTNVTSKFSSVSKQITKQSLSGSKIIRSDVVSIGKGEYFCSMAVLSEQKTAQLFNSLMEQAEVDVDKATENEFKEMFISQPNLDSEVAHVKKLIDED